MSKGKIIVASMMLFFVLCFAAIAAWFLLIKNNDAQSINKEQRVAILHAAGLTSGKEDDQALNTLFENRVMARQVNLDSGTLLPASTPQDAQKSCVNLPADQDPAQVRQRCNIAEVYLVQNNRHEIQQIILPVSGKGAKSVLRGFIALETDGRTVKNLSYYEHNETPKLGAKVDDPQWLSQWPGKKVLNDDARPALKVVQESSGPHDDYTVDGITGATMTSTSVEKSINFWVGDRGYGHFLQRVAKDKKLLSD